MAADLIMPTLPGDQHSRHFFPQQQRPTHQRNQSYQISVGPQISPINTNESTSPDSASSTPTSPRAHHARQTRPMYMPAALRPNLFPSKTNKIPIDDAASISSTEPDGALRRTNSSLINLPGISVFSNKLARVSTGDSTQSSIDGDFDPEMFPEVKAQPTRKHWKPDAESTVCDDPTCKRTFSYFTRRHHCRKCGHIFCDSHSTFAAPLDHDAKFNPRAPLFRTCRHCCEEFKSWYTRNSSRASSAASSDAPNPTPSTPIGTGFGDASELPRGPELAASVPRDWNWSTF